MFARFRLSEPWRYKAPFLISVVYFFLYVNSVRFADALLAVACALCTICGFAGVGYLSNDVSDREADVKAGKPNATVGLSRGRLVALFALFGAGAVLPWVMFVPVDRAWVALLVLEFVLFALYAVPPFRLKERGLLGPVTDAMYAHANPALLAAYTMHLVTGKRYPQALWWVASLWTWQLFVGLRNIIRHQMTDAAHDRDAGTVTWVTRAGQQAAARALRNFIVPVEVSAFAAWLVVTSSAVPVLAVVFAVHVTCTALVIRRYSGRLSNQPLHEMLVLFLDDFFVGWMPLVVLVALATLDWRMAALPVLHVAVFQDRLRPLFAFWFRTMREVWLARSPTASR